jgi:hypothetical protein
MPTPLLKKFTYYKLKIKKNVIMNYKRKASNRLPSVTERGNILCRLALAIYVCTCSLSLFAQQSVNVTDTVTDENNDALPDLRSQIYNNN